MLGAGVGDGVGTGVGEGEGVGVGDGEGEGDGVGDGVGDGDGFGLAVGDGATVGADPPPACELGRMATTVSASASTTPSARMEGAAALRVVDRVSLQVGMERSSVADRADTTEVRPNRAYDM